MIVFYKYGFARVFEQFYIQLNSAAIIVITLFFLIYNNLEILRLRIIYSAFSVKISYFPLLLIANASYFIALTTPGNLGGLIKIYYLKCENNKWLESLSCVAFEKACDIIFILSAGAVCTGILLPSRMYFIQYNYILIGLFIMFLLLIVKFVNFKKILIKAERSLKLAQYELYLNIREKIIEIYKLIKNIKLNNIPKIVIIYLISFAFYAFVLQRIGKYMNVNISFIHIVITIFTAYFAELIPISIAGLGTREILIINILTMAGYSKETAVVFSSVFLIILLLSFIIGFVCWLLKPIKLNSPKFALENIKM